MEPPLEEEYGREVDEVELEAVKGIEAQVAAAMVARVASLEAEEEEQRQRNPAYVPSRQIRARGTCEMASAGSADAAEANAG